MGVRERRVLPHLTPGLHVYVSVKSAQACSAVYGCVGWLWRNHINAVFAVSDRSLVNRSMDTVGMVLKMTLTQNDGVTVETIKLKL